MSAGGDNSLKAVVVAVGVNGFITVLKFIGWVMTGSPSLLAESIHSLADVGNQFLLWIGIRESAKDATPEHPYGWGSARYLWNLKSAMGIFFLGSGVTLYHGLSHGWHALKGDLPPTPPVEEGSIDPTIVGISILVVAVILEGYSWWVAYKEVNAGRGETSWSDFISKGDDPTGVGVLLEDTAAVGGVFLALGGLGLSRLTGSPIPDIVATILIGILLAWVAIFLAKANGRLLIGAAVDSIQLELIRKTLEDDPIVERVVDLKTLVMGSGQMRVKCEIDLYEKLVAAKITDALKEDARRLEKGEQPMKVLVDVVGRSVRAAANEIQRLDAKVKAVAPNAVHIDLELI
ncbi:MAG: cation diffusion facilitator family transporter [Planctomycetes bacterium]|nr:cation diffusion facilitator family transporter [Planctomycetota bacterium]